MKAKLKKLWDKIYKNDDKFDELIKFIEQEKENYKEYNEDENEWYKDAIIYSLYVDLYAENFDGMIKRLGYLKELGVNTLWLLPILDSPMRDAGFDIRDYYKVRKEIGGNIDFFRFIKEAHKYGIKIIFDMAVNHTSEEHEWFRDAKSNKNSKYRDYYIWTENVNKYKEARLLFKGMVNSNWQKNNDTDDYYFHRFYEFQPDLNYKNPNVIIDMIKTMAFWKRNGVDGLRMDAIPFLWKEEGTNCENLEKTHIILKIFRTALDYIAKGTLFVAEANMQPKDVVEYFGEGDECQAAYHFPLMPKFYLAQAEETYSYILEAMSEEATPKIPEGCQWISFLRCHDELTLEFVNEDERKKMNRHYLKDSKYSFRHDEGIAGRLFDLMDGNADRICNIFSMLFTTEGAPVIYYGDEIGMRNDEKFYLENIRNTGHKDSRFYNRGKMDWERAKNAIFDKTSPEGKIYYGLRNIINNRKKYADLFAEKKIFVVNADRAIYETKRRSDGKVLNIIHNLSNEKKVLFRENMKGINILDDKKIEERIELEGYGYMWILSEE